MKKRPAAAAGEPAPKEGRRQSAKEPCKLTNFGKCNCGDGTGVVDADRQRLQQFLAERRLLHPIGEGSVSFADLARGLAKCCGIQVPPPDSHAERAELAARSIAEDLGGVQKRHIVVILCDGMGNEILARHLASDAFLRRHNDDSRLLAVFPSTTPAALTTLATGVWPGQHGLPGWDLRDQLKCEFPAKEAGPGHIQLRILNPIIADMRSGKPVSDLGFELDRVFVAKPWANSSQSHRRILYVNAYSGTDFTNWHQGSSMEHVRSIPETVAETLGSPEGAEKAVSYFAQAVDHVAQAIQEADEGGWPSYIYVYTAHPDKPMHALGIDHREVVAVVRGINEQVERLWGLINERDVSLLVTADHGHVTVEVDQMVSLPEDLLELLEYANIGVHGKGRHACLHCRCGRQKDFEERWAQHPMLQENFLLFTVEAAAEEGLFGPVPPKPEVRPRLGDFVAISLGNHTLVTPGEAANFRDGERARCQGAHGSITAEEMRIPYVRLRGSGRASSAAATTGAAA